MATRQRTAVNTALGLAMLLHLGVSVAAGGAQLAKIAQCNLDIAAYNQTTDKVVNLAIFGDRQVIPGVTKGCFPDRTFTNAERREAKGVLLPVFSEENAEGVIEDCWDQWNSIVQNKCRSGYAYVLGSPRAVVEKYLNAYTCSTTRPSGGFNAHLRKK